MKIFGVRGDYITLGQLVKMVGAADTGGEAKSYVAEATIRVNGERENRRGKKLRPGDVVDLPGSGAYTLSNTDEQENGV